MRIRSLSPVAAVAILASALVAAPVANAKPAGDAREACTHRTGVSHPGGIFDEPFTEDSICGNDAGAPLYAGTSKGSGQVAILDTTSSWFLCWARGEQHSGGNDVWYYTQGDRVVNDPARQGYGFVPASYLATTNDPDDSNLAQCPKVPTEMSASYMVYDRQTGAADSKDEHQQIRSASLVKILIVLDYLEMRGPGAEIPPADLALLRSMLRVSDDDAASTLWTRGGSTKIVDRMVAKIGLSDTTPPERPGMWGYTAISAADMVTTYRHVLEKAHPEFRDFIMGNLHQAQQCAADGWDQYFGIPRAVPRPWAVKQGWSGFGNVPPGGTCDPAAAKPAVRPASAGPDLRSGALHTSGTMCANDRKIMVVLTLHPVAVSSADAAQRLTALTKSLYTKAGC